MYSLTDLNLSGNNFTDVGSILTLGELPCLEFVDFRENAMTKEPMYRIRVFSAFDDRAEQVNKYVVYLYSDLYNLLNVSKCAKSVYSLITLSKRTPSLRWTSAWLAGPAKFHLFIVLCLFSG